MKNTELILASQFSELLHALKLKWDTTAPAVGLGFLSDYVQLISFVLLLSSGGNFYAVVLLILSSVSFVAHKLIHVS